MSPRLYLAFMLSLTAAQYRISVGDRFGTVLGCLAALVCLAVMYRAGVFTGRDA